MRSFDRKFGAGFISGLPTGPGVYRVFDESETLIYIGKAKNLRRRLGQYRNAKRRKKHRKMKSIVAEAARIDFILCSSELEAELLETRLIQERRPKWNVAGAFFFLYPMVGIARADGVTRFCFTTLPDQVAGYELHGAFRSRHFAGEAFFALMRLLRYVGHPARSRREDRRKHVYELAFRQLPESWVAMWSRFFRGESREALEALILALIENAGARRKPREIQDELNALGRFWRHEALPLARARAGTGRTAYPVAQKERDLLMLEARYRRAASTRPAAREGT